MTRFARENGRWIGHLDDYLLNHLNVLDTLPEDVHFILMPADDPELAYYNVQTALRNLEGWQTPVAVFIQMNGDMPSFRFEGVKDVAALLFEAAPSA